ncbi:uncharacterized protein [Physcomitrium patens]|uniref:uncharacterized protein n=1 Tax=Physcomitrium patens TaxID=3218 RepID=UPI003CCD3E24
MGAPGPLLAGQYLTTTCILPPTSIWSGVKRENRIFLREGFPRVKITWMTPTAIKSTHLPYSTSTSREHTRQLSGANSTARRELELSRPSTIQSRTKNRNPMSFPGLVVVQYRG